MKPIHVDTALKHAIVIGILAVVCTLCYLWPWLIFVVPVGLFGLLLVGILVRDIYRCLFELADDIVRDFRRMQREKREALDAEKN